MAPASMVSTEGCGRPSTNVTSRSPFTVTALRLNHHGLRGLLRSFDSGEISMSQVHFTSALVKGLPSCHFTPSRSLKVSSVPSAFHAHSVASSGTMWSGAFCFDVGSKTTRLLYTDMNGMTVEIVASSWIEALGGLSRCVTL